MTRLYLRVYGDPFNIFSGYVVVDLTAEYLEVIRERALLVLGLAEKDDNIYQLRYWDYTPDAYEGSPFGGESEAHNKDCSMLVVKADGIYWRWLRKHCNDEMNTATLSLEQLARIQGEGDAYWVDEELIDEWDPHEEMSLDDVTPYLEIAHASSH